MQESAHTQEEKEMTIRDIVLSLQKWLNYLLSKWLIIGASTLLGALIGLGIYYFSKSKYVAESNFVLEGDNKGGQGGLGAALGLGGEATAGLFSSVDNIIWLYTSNNMLKQTLLTKIETRNGEKDLLINQFRRTSSDVNKRISKNPDLGKIYFGINDNSLSNEQESFIRMCISILKDEYLDIKPVEKTENIISVKMTAEDEFFAYTFTRELVGIVNDFYIKTKTRKTQQQVDQLSAKADSLKRSLGVTMEYTATSIDNIPYPNPNLSVLRVEPQRSNIDVQTNTAMYVQVSQSLEAARNELSKETPIIQIVDEPVLPLPKKKVELILALGIGAAVGLILSTIWLILRKVYTDIIN